MVEGVIVPSSNKVVDIIKALFKGVSELMKLPLLLCLVLVVVSLVIVGGGIYFVIKGLVAFFKRFRRKKHPSARVLRKPVKQPEPWLELVK